MGGTQFNGLALVHELVRAGHDVTICNRGRSHAQLPEGVKRLVADRTDHAQLRSVIGNTDWDCVQDISAYHPPDVEVMIDTLAGRVGHYLFASSTVIYAAKDELPITENDALERGPDQIEYGLHKILCEELLLEAHATAGFPCTIVPFSMVFGPHNPLRDREQRMFARILMGRPVLVPGDGTTLLQLGHVDDQARALEQIMGKAVAMGKRYNLTATEGVSRNDYVATMGRVLQLTPEVVNIPAQTMEALWTGALQLGAGDSSVGMDIRTSKPAAATPRATTLRRRFQVAQLVQHLAPNIHWWDQSTVFSTELLRSEIGWEPQHTLESMVEHTYRWFVDEGLHRGHATDWEFEDQLLETVGQ